MPAKLSTGVGTTASNPTLLPATAAAPLGLLPEPARSHGSEMMMYFWVCKKRGLPSCFFGSGQIWG